MSELFDSAPIAETVTSDADTFDSTALEITNVQQDSQPADDTTVNETLSFREKFSRLRQAGGEDFRTAGVLQKVGLTATAAWLAYEWGPGNETVTPIIGGAVINSVSGTKGIAIAGAIAGGFTFVQQTLSGATVAATATQFPRLTEAAFSMMSDDEHPELNAKPWAELPRGQRLLYSFTMGTTFIASREAAVTGEAKFKDLMPRVLASAAMTSVAVAGVASGVEAVDYYTENAPKAVEVGGDIVIGVLTNPITWLALLGVSAYKNRRQRQNLRDSLQATT